MKQKINIGILGAARIARAGIIKPARFQKDVNIIGIAARDVSRAELLAKKNQIPRVHRTYEELLADRDIDAIYNPLPNSHHHEWTMKALEAGKHVLCEKPIASNALQATEMVALAAEKGLVLAEAIHNLYHPISTEMMKIINDGVIGKIRRVEAHFCTPMFKKNDIRYEYDLAGGATMDLGCYAIRLMRMLTGADQQAEKSTQQPKITAKVMAAEATCMSPQVDQYMSADFLFTRSHLDEQTDNMISEEIPGHMTCALKHRAFPRITAWIIGESGVLQVINPFVPHRFNRLVLMTKTGEGRGKKVSRFVRGKSSYFYQLQEFVKAVQGEENRLISAEDSIETMRLIDDIYEMAGLKKRGLW